MKKRKIKLLFILLIALFITACGIQSKENMKVDNNFKGERLIQLTFDADTFNRANGGKQAVIDFLSNNVMAPLELNYIKDEPDFIEAEYSLKFGNQEDYINKINTLYQLGNIQEEIVLNFQIENERFNKSVEFQDNSDVQKIFSSLINKAIEDNIMYEDDLSRIWSTKRYSLTINNNEYIKDSDYIYGNYSENEYIGPRSINVITSRAEENNKFNRMIVLYFDEGNYLKLDKNWEDNFILSENTKFEQNNENSSVRFLYDSFTQDQINQETAHFFGVESMFSMQKKNNGEKLKILEELKDFMPENDLSNKSITNFLYYFDSIKPEDLPLEEIISQDKINERMLYVGSLDLHNGIEKVIETNIVFDKIQIRSKLSEENISRTLIFPKKNQEEIVNSNLKAYLDSLAIKYIDSKDDIKVEYIYDFENASDVHNKLFNSQIKMKPLEGNVFKLKKQINEEATFKELKAEKIEHISNVQDLGKIYDDKFHQNDTKSYQYIISYETTKGSSIITTGIIIVASLVGLLLVFKLLNKKNTVTTNNKDSNNEEQLNTDKKKSRRILDESNRKILYDENDDVIDSNVETEEDVTESDDISSDDNKESNEFAKKTD